MLTSDRSAQVLLFYHRQNYDRGSEALGLGRAARYFAAEVDGIDQGVQTSAVLHALIRHCNALPGKARRYRRANRQSTQALETKGKCSSALNLCRPKNQLFQTGRRNSINMLAHRFCIAPMMDWSESSIFSKCWKAVCARCVHREIKENLATTNVSVQRINCPSTQIWKP